MEDLLGVSYGMLLAMKNILRAVHNEVHGNDDQVNDEQELLRELGAQSRAPGHSFIKDINVLALLVKEMFDVFISIKEICDQQ